MGIHQLWRLLKEVNRGAGSQLPLSQFKGKVVVVDVSIWLIEFLKGTRNRDLISSWFNGIPARSLRPLLKQHFDMRLKPFRENEITIQLVLDGSRNPLKKETNEARIERSRDAGEQFKKFLSDDSVYEEVELLHILHEMVQPRIDIYRDLLHWAKHNGVTITAAPIESDWQLSFASFSRDADLVISKDGDVFACGAVLQATEIDWSKNDPIMTVWSQEKHMPPLLERFGIDKRSKQCLLDLFSLFIFMGCDYLPNVTGVGAKTLSSEGYFSRWLVANKAEKEAILKSIEDEGMGLRFAS